MKLHLQKAIDLFNARVKATTPNYKDTDLLNLQRLGKKIKPDAEYHVIGVSMSRLNGRGAKSIKLEWLQIICDELSVDPNFIFGVESEYDVEYSKYFG